MNTMPEGSGDLRRAVVPLRMIFWGGLLCLVDFKINSGGLKIDLLDDFVGMLLITVGVFRLASLDDEPSYRSGMAFVKVVGILSTIKSLIDHVGFDGGTLWSLGEMALALAELGAVLVFCRAMRRLCVRHNLDVPAESWKTTFLLYTLLYVGPMGLFYLACLGAMLLQTRFNLNLGPAGLLILVVFCIPLVHLFVSTSRMRRAAEA